MAKWYEGMLGFNGYWPCPLCGTSMTLRVVPGKGPDYVCHCSHPHLCPPPGARRWEKGHTPDTERKAHTARINVSQISEEVQEKIRALIEQNELEIQALHKQNGRKGGQSKGKKKKKKGGTGT